MSLLYKVQRITQSSVKTKNKINSVVFKARIFPSIGFPNLADGRLLGPKSRSTGIVLNNLSFSR